MPSWTSERLYSENTLGLAFGCSGRGRMRCVCMPTQQELVLIHANFFIEGGQEVRAGQTFQAPTCRCGIRLCQVKNNRKMHGRRRGIRRSTAKPWKAVCLPNHPHHPRGRTHSCSAQCPRMCKHLRTVHSYIYLRDRLYIVLEKLSGRPWEDFRQKG